MSTSRDSCCLPSVKKQKHDFQVFAFVQCIIKQLLDSVFVISRIIKVSVRVISLSLRLRLITLTSTLIILDITKTSSNNCLKLHAPKFNYHFIRSILKSHNLIIAYSVNSKTTRFWSVPSCQICQTMAFFLFHFPAMRMVS